MTDHPSLGAQLEALLVVAEGPIPGPELARMLAVAESDVEDSLLELATSYEARGSGIRVRRVATGWELFAAPEFHTLIRNVLHDEQPTRLTQASLETLAVVAYRQPVTRARIGAIRAVNADAAVRTLVSRGLIEEVGVEEGSGAILYGTTPLFLEKIGLPSVTELPPLSDYLPDLEDVLGPADLTSM